MDALSCNIVDIITGPKQKYFLIDVCNIATNNNDTTKTIGNIQERRLYVADIEYDNKMVHAENIADKYITNISNVYDAKNKHIVHNMYAVNDKINPFYCRSSTLKNQHAENIDKDSADAYTDLFLPKSMDILSICKLKESMFILNNKITNGACYNTHYAIYNSENKEFVEFDKIIEEPIYTALYRSSTDILEDAYTDLDGFIEKLAPSAYIDKIKYNQIYEFPTSNYALLNDSTVLANSIICKNHLGYDYSQHGTYNTINSAGSINELRTYKRIFKCGNSVYSVYCNDTTASYVLSANTNPADKNTNTTLFTVSSETDTNANIVEISDNISTTKKCLTGKSFERVECVTSINRFNKANTHKTNLYSIEINGLGIQQANDNEKLKPIIQKIKKSIYNGVKAICEKTQPANTQLFNVIFNK